MLVPIHQFKSGVTMSQISDLCSFLSVLEEAGQLVRVRQLVALEYELAAELAPHVRVKAIDPGTVLLPENASETKVQWAEQNPFLKRVGTPKAMAKTALFVTEMDFVTGAVYLVDGGRALV